MSTSQKGRNMVKVRLCPNGITVDMKQNSGGSNVYYLYKGSRYKNIHMKNKKKCIFVKKENTYVPISSKSVVKIGGANNANGSDSETADCVQGTVFIPEPIQKQIASQPQNLKDTINIYLAFNMKDKAGQFKTSHVIKYLRNNIATALSGVDSLKIYAHFFDLHRPVNEKVSKTPFTEKVYIFKRHNEKIVCRVKTYTSTLDNGRTNEKNETYNVGKVLSTKFVFSDYYISDIQIYEPNDVWKDLLEYITDTLPKVGLRFRINCVTKRYHWDPYFEEGTLAGKLQIFCSKYHKLLIHNMVSLINYTLTLEPKNHINKYWKVSANINTQGASDEQDYEAHIRSIFSDIYKEAKAVVEKQGNADINLVSLIEDLDKVIQCMHCDEEEMWEIMFPEPDIPDP